LENFAGAAGSAGCRRAACWRLGAAGGCLAVTSQGVWALGLAGLHLGHPHSHCTGGADVGAAEHRASSPLSRTCMLLLQQCTAADTGWLSFLGHSSNFRGGRRAGSGRQQALHNALVHAAACAGSQCWPCGPSSSRVDHARGAAIHLPARSRMAPQPVADAC
jgi:hypothetical protein